MKICVRSVILAAPLVAGLIVASCSQATTAPFSSQATTGVSSPSSTVGSAALSTNTLWKLQSLAETGSPAVTIADPSAFTMTLTDDGKVQAQADCNRASASYVASGQTLSVGLMASTMAYCPSAPVDTQYLALLGGENVATSDGASLQLSSARGTLRFVR